MLTVLPLVLTLLGAPAPSPLPVTRCDDERLAISIAGGELLVDGDGIWLAEAGALVSPAADATNAPAQPEAPKAISIFTPDGEAYELTLGATWSLGQGDTKTELERPRGVREKDVPSLLGSRDGFAWLSLPGLVMRVEAASGKILTATVPRDSALPVALHSGKELLVGIGERLVVCEGELTCRERGKLPGALRAVVGDSESWLYLTETPRGGAVLVAEQAAPLETRSLFAAASVVPCVMGNEAWFVAAEADGGWRLVRAGPKLGEPEVLQRREALLSALYAPRSSPLAIAAMIDAAGRESWPELEPLALLASVSGHAGVRASAALALAKVGNTRGFAALWLLGQDREVGVRVAALEGTADWCRAQRTVPCAVALGPFLRDASEEVSWTARDRLLVHDPTAALRGAPPAYRREAISQITALLERHGDPRLREALAELARDKDPTVRQAAAMALTGLDF